MKKVISIGLSFFYISNIFIQAQTNSLKIDFKYIGDSTNFRISVENKNNDSVLYFFTCRMLSPSDYRPENVVKLFPIRRSDEQGRDFYNPYYTILNREVSMEAPAYEAIAILPNQTKCFDIRFLKVAKEVFFSISYFYTNNYCHEEFEAEIKNPKWYSKYDRREFSQLLKIW